MSLARWLAATPFEARWAHWLATTTYEEWKRMNTFILCRLLESCSNRNCNQRFRSPAVCYERCRTSSLPCPQVRPHHATSTWFPMAARSWPNYVPAWCVGLLLPTRPSPVVLGCWTSSCSGCGVLVTSQISVIRSTRELYWLKSTSMISDSQLPYTFVYRRLAVFGHI